MKNNKNTIQLAADWHALESGLVKIAELAQIDPSVLLARANQQVLLTNDESFRNQLLFSLARALKTDSRIAELFKHKHPPKMIGQLRKIMPRKLNQLDAAEQLRHIQELLAELGFKGVNRYPLMPYESEECTLNSESAKNFTLADEWIHEVQAICKMAYNLPIALTDMQRLGLLTVRLALVDGVFSSAELRGCLVEISNGRVRFQKPLIWTSTRFTKKKSELRRQILSNETFALASSIDWVNLGITCDNAQRKIEAAIKSLGKISTKFASCSVRLLRAASADRFRLSARVPHFLVDFMAGDLISSSLSESGFARQMSKGIADIDEVADSTYQFEADDKKVIKAPLARKKENDSFELSALSRVIKLLAQKAPKTNIAAQQLILEEQARLTPSEGLISQLLEFAYQRLDAVKSHATVHQQLTYLRAHLLGPLEDLSAIEDPDEWSDLVELISADLPPKSSAISAISAFGRFLSRSYAEDFMTIGESEASDVNAQLITYQDMQKASHILSVEQGRAKGERGTLLMMIGGLCGARRGEIDGLVRSSVFLFEPSGSFLRIITNLFRGLKTKNANRYAPLDSLQIQFPSIYSHLKLVYDSQADIEPGSLLFKSDEFEPLSGQSKDLFHQISVALQKVTGQKMAKFHSLRHSFCCYLLLALYFDRLQLSRYTEIFPFLKEIESYKDIAVAVFGSPSTANRFEPGIVRLAMGHLSFSTSFQHYFHFAELLRFAALATLNDELAYSEPELLGALGYTRGSRLLRSKRMDAAALLKERLASCHELSDLPPPVLGEYDFDEETRELVMQLEKSMLFASQDSSQSVDLMTFGKIDQQSINEIRDWVSATISNTAIGREVSAPFAELTDKQARRAVNHMAGNLRVLSAGELATKAEELRALISQQSGSYLSFKFDLPERFEAAQTLLELLLSNYPTAYTVTERVKVGQKLHVTAQQDVSSLASIQSKQGHRYTVKMTLSTGAQFPHRALIWVAIALSLATSNQYKKPQVAVASTAT